MKLKHTLMAFAALTCAAHAASVSVNLGANQRSVTKDAGVVNDSTWENINDSGGAGSALNVDSSTIDVSWVAHNIWRTNAANVTGGDQLMRGRWDSGIDGDVITITDINATYANYDVIVYYAYNQGSSHEFDLSVGGGTAVHIQHGGQNATAGASDLGINNYLTNGPSNGTDPSHWHRFTGLSADSITFNVSNRSGRTGFTGFQIVQVPEPSSAALLGLGGLALILRRRK